MANERKIWITLGKGGDVEEPAIPCVIQAYATKELAADAVAKSLGARHKLESKLRATKSPAERHEFLSSAEAVYLNRKITGEEWYEEILLVEG